MFLDEHLYTHTKSKEINSADDFSDLVNELYRICEDHYKPLLNNENAVIKATLNRTFKSWDIFIEKLKKEEWFLVDILSQSHISYKSAFLSNPKLKQIYEGL